MICLSANEIYHTARKAALGSGLAHDRAEDIAAAVSLLQSAGISGCACLCEMLSQMKDTGPAADNQAVPRPHVHMKADSLYVENLRPAIEGVAIIDWLLAAPETAMAEAGHIEHWLLFAGLLSAAGYRYNCQFSASCETAAFTLHLPPAAFDAAFADNGLDRPPAGTRITCSPLPSGSQLSAPVSCHSGVDDGVWARLEDLASLTYVPETEMSRLSGAGAGLVDND